MTTAVVDVNQKTYSPDVIQHYCELLNRDGYVLVKDVLSPAEVTQLRTFFKAKWAPGQTYEGNDSQESIFELYERFEELRNLLFKEPAIQILQKELGDDFVLLRDSGATFNRYGWWWHKDTSNEERAGHTYHHHPDFRRLLVSFYLQDNHPIYGGGLDVEKGSHLHRDPGFQYPEWVLEKDPLWRRILRRPLSNKKMVPVYNDHFIKKPFSVPSKAGDMIIFDVKLSHRATQKKVDVVPSENEKIAIFTHFSRNNKTVEDSQAYFDEILPENNKLRTYSEKLKAMAAKVGMKLL